MGSALCPRPCLPDVNHVGQTFRREQTVSALPCPGLDPGPRRYGLTSWILREGGPGSSPGRVCAEVISLVFETYTGRTSDLYTLALKSEVRPV